MANVYKIVAGTNSVEICEAVKSVADKIGLPSYFRQDRAQHDVVVFTVNDGRKCYFHVNDSLNFHVTELKAESDTSSIFSLSCGSMNQGLGIREVHIYGYDSPRGIFVFAKRGDDVWMQAAMTYIDHVGTRSGFVVSTNTVMRDGLNSAHAFPVEFDYDQTKSNRILFGGWRYYNHCGGMVNILGGNPGTENWFYHSKARGKPRVTHATHYFNHQYGDTTSAGSGDLSVGILGWNKIATSKQSFGWGAHLVSIPVLLYQNVEHYSHVGYVAHIRATRSESLDQLDKINVAGQDYMAFPMMRNSPSISKRISSHDYFWLMPIRPGQEVPEYGGS